jgi:hypothetical protein
VAGKEEAGMNGRNVLTSIWRAWKRIGRAIGDLIGRLVLTVFYFTIFVPFAVGVRVFRRGDSHGSASGGHWDTRELDSDDMIKAKRLY